MLTEKLKGLKAQLKAWNKNSFTRVEVKKETLKKVKEWDDLDGEGAENVGPKRVQTMGPIGRNILEAKI